MEKTARGQSADLMSDKCYICLSPFEEQTLGSLEDCQHVFCLQCILQWSQTANTCPVDRTTFAFIHQRRCPGGDIQKKIKVTAPKKDEDEEEEGSGPVFCEECGRSDRRQRMLVCLRCDSGYHMECLRPPLNTTTDDDWTCHDCVVSSHHSESSMLEEVISDGELTDLLAEVDETATTSSRLRPSTLNRPRSPAGRRHSARIQSRASPDHHPQTSWHVPKYLIKATKPIVTAESVHQTEACSSPAVRLKKRKRKKHAA